VRTGITTFQHRGERLQHFRSMVAETTSDLVTMALARDQKCDATAVRVARELHALISVHGNPVRLLQDFASADAWARDVSWVDGNCATQAGLSALAASSTSVSLTPDIEMGMGNQSPSSTARPGFPEPGDVVTGRPRHQAPDTDGQPIGFGGT
jgi:hypothetical protein